MWPNEAYEAGPSRSGSQSGVSSPENHRSELGRADSEQRMNVSNTNNGGIRRDTSGVDAEEGDDGEERRGREGVWAGRSGLRKGEFFSCHALNPVQEGYVVLYTPFVDLTLTFISLRLKTSPTCRLYPLDIQLPLIYTHHHP
jgi:hypothetical protein